MARDTYRALIASMQLDNTQRSAIRWDCNNEALQLPNYAVGDCISGVVQFLRSDVDPPTQYRVVLEELIQLCEGNTVYTHARVLQTAEWTGSSSSSGERQNAGFTFSHTLKISPSYFGDIVYRRFVITQSTPIVSLRHFLRILTGDIVHCESEIILNPQPSLPNVVNASDIVLSEDKKHGVEVVFMAKQRW